MKKVLAIVFAAAILSAVMLTACHKPKNIGEPVDNPVYTSAPKGEQIIDEATAKRAAAECAEIPVEDIKFHKVVLDYDDGRYEYEIEFVHGKYEYEFEINASDGRVIDWDKEIVG